MKNFKILILIALAPFLILSSTGSLASVISLDSRATYLLTSNYDAENGAQSSDAIDLSAIGL